MPFLQPVERCNKSPQLDLIRGHNPSHRSLKKSIFTLLVNTLWKVCDSAVQSSTVVVTRDKTCLSLWFNLFLFPEDARICGWNYCLSEAVASLLMKQIMTSYMIVHCKLNFIRRFFKSEWQSPLQQWKEITSKKNKQTKYQLNALDQINSYGDACF